MSTESLNLVYTRGKNQPADFSSDEPFGSCGCKKFWRMKLLSLCSHGWAAGNRVETLLTVGEGKLDYFVAAQST